MKATKKTAPAREHATVGPIVWENNILGRPTPEQFCLTCGEMVEVKPRQNGAYYYCKIGLEAAKYGTYKKLSNCERCGKSRKVIGLEVHHITGNKAYEAHSDLKTLCVGCHSEFEICVRRLLQRVTADAMATFKDFQANGFASANFWETSTLANEARARK